MNYKVPLSVFLFLLIHVHSAIISVKPSNNGKRELQKTKSTQTHRFKNLDTQTRQFLIGGEKVQALENKILSRSHQRTKLPLRKLTRKAKRCPRVYLGDSSDNHNTIVASPMQIIKNRVCDKCKQSELCKVKGQCHHCIHYCKPTEVKRDIQMSREEINNFPENEQPGEENLQMNYQEPDDDVVLMVHQPEGEAQTLEERNEEIVQSNANDDSMMREAEAEADHKRGKKIQRRHESRYYPVGAINHGIALKILLKLTHLPKSADVEKAVVLVKSKTPIEVDGVDQTDTDFLRFLGRELERAEKNREGAPLSVKEMNRLLQNAYEKAEEESEELKSRRVGIENPMPDNEKNETVGCSKEQSETVPFFPIQPNIYRSHSSQSETPFHKNIATEPDIFDTSEESMEEKHSKNPGVIQGNPSIKSRSNALKASSVRERMIDSLSNQLKRLENMNFVGSSKSAPNLSGLSRDAEDLEQEEKQETDEEKEKGFNQAPEDQRKIETIDSQAQESEEDNDQARHSHQKNKKSKKGGAYPSSYGYGNSYGSQNSHGQHGPSYGSHNYREAETTQNILSATNRKSPKTTSTNEKADESINEYDQKRKELVGAEQDDLSEDQIPQSRTHTKKVKHPHNGNYLPSYRTTNGDEILIPGTNITLDKKQFLSARPDLDSHDGISQSFHDRIHDHWKKIQQANIKKLEEAGITIAPARNSTESVTLFPEDTATDSDDDGASRLFGITENTTSILGAMNSTSILGTEHNDQGGYYRVSDTSSAQHGDSDEELDTFINKNHADRGEEMKLSETSGVGKIQKNLPTVGIRFEPEDSMNLQIANQAKGSNIQMNKGTGFKSVKHVHGTMHRHSQESMESNESFEHHFGQKNPTQHFSDQPQIPGKKLEEMTNTHHHQSKKQHSPIPSTHSMDHKFVMEQPNQFPKDKTKIDHVDKAMPGSSILQVDDQLIDVPKEGHSIFQNGQSRMAIVDEDTLNNDVVGETPELSGNDENQEFVENIVGAHNMPMEELKMNPQIMSDPSGQNLGLIVDVNDVSTVKPEFPFKIFPSKMIPNIPIAGSISASAPAFGENRTIEIHIPNFVSTPIERGVDTLEPFSVTEQVLEMTEIPVTDNSRGVDVVGAKLMENNNIDPKSIDKLITPQEQEFLHNFGKIVPAAEKMHLNTNTDVYFMGNGIKLPLKVSQNRDGSLALSVDLEKLCKCKSATCTHRREMMRQLDNNLVPLVAEEPTEKEKADVKNNQGISVERKIRKARHHIDLSKIYKNYNKKHHRLHKRSLEGASKNNILDNKNNDDQLTERSRKAKPASDLKNFLVKESDHKQTVILKRGDIHLNDIEKFKEVVKMLEGKLEKLHEDVQKSSWQSSNMLQQGTKDLLQIKGEDQVVKHRIELVSDLLKWMKEMAEGMETFNVEVEKKIQ